MTIAVKRYTSAMTGAPSLTGTVGSLITLLDACLKDGFNSKSVSTAEQTAGVATVTTSGAHGYAVDDVVAISGANESAWNNEFRVLTAAANSFTCALDAATPSPATGTLSVKIAPLGWTKPFSGTDKAAYLPKAPYVQCYLRVQDDASTPTSANGRWATVRGYESMSDVDTGTGLFPTVAQSANGVQWMKAPTAGAAARDWWLVGDGGIVYFGSNASLFNLYSGHLFGDINSLKSGDAYSSAIHGFTTDTEPNWPGDNKFTEVNNSSPGLYLARSYTQLGESIAGHRQGATIWSLYMGYGGLTYPNPAGNGLVFAPVAIGQGTSVMRSAALPGLYHPLHLTPLAYLEKVADVPSLPGRTLQAFDLSVDIYRAQCLFDITGPWR